MTDHEGLYRAIIANPLENTPRLVYADWLEENDRAEEAEFIRLDCRLELCSPDEPDYFDSLERLEELRLWLGTHAPGPRLKLRSGLQLRDGSDWWGHTLRGFPRFLEVTGTAGSWGGAKGIRKIAGAIEHAFAIMPTRWLVVDRMAIEELAELLDQPVLAAVERLTTEVDRANADEAARLIADCPYLRNLRGATLLPFGDVGAEAIGRTEYLTRLEWLSIDVDQLTPAGVRSLERGGLFASLRELYWEGSTNTDAFIELCRLPPHPHLHTLHLKEMLLPASAWREFAQSHAFPQLKRLELNNSDLSGGQIAALANANGFRLASINLTACAIGHEGVQTLLSEPWVDSLRSINLYYNLISWESISALAECKGLCGLQHLNLTGNPIGASGLQAIAASPYLRNLRSLVLENCAAGNRDRITPGDLLEFLTRLELPHLRRLDLSNSPLGARAASLLTAEKFSKLTRLKLNQCKLTATAAAELIEAPALQNLVELSLANNGLSAGIGRLTDHSLLPRLSSCDLRNNPIPDELTKKLLRRPGLMLL
jgi:uncharacterized protein (TIGR02996 family)